MTHDDDDQQLKALHAEIDRLLDRLLQYKQDIARHRRVTELIRRLPIDLSETIDRQLLEKMLQAEGDRAAQKATGEFPEFVNYLLNRAEKRKE
jgi:hypothetical protein